MNWKKKVEALTHLSGERPELEMYFAVAPPAPQHFLNELRGNYPFIPGSYLEFLRISDGIQLHWFWLGGSGESDFESVNKLIKRWKPIIGERAMLPIGEESSGDAFVLTETTIEILPQPRYGDSKVLTTDFDELMNEFFLGRKYPLMFSKGPSTDDPWLALLRELGWA